MALVFALAAQVGLALTPHLIDRAPVLLLLLRPQLEMVLLLSGIVDPLIVIAVVAPLRWLVHFTYTELGRSVGPTILLRSRTGRRVTARLANCWTRRALLLSCLVHLGTPVDLALGSTGTPRRQVALVLGLGALLSTSFYVMIGRALVPTAAQVLDWIVENRVRATVAFAIAGVAAWLVTRRSFPTESADPARRD